jgi:hypothetical protein
MKQVCNRLLTVAFAVTLAVSAASTARAAGDRQNEPVAHTVASLSAVEWQVGVDGERVVLTVSGPDGFTYSKSFASGSNPSFRLADITSKNPDGAYTYELRVTPRVAPEIRRRLEAARTDGDDTAIARITSEAGLGAGLVQSGNLIVTRGAFVPSNQIESSPSAKPRAVAASSTTVSASAAPHVGPIHALDTVIADDEIIQGSLCVGLDCVNGEVFGFTTIKLKENNTRILFEDTSASTGFATHDWQLTANDSASGGAEKFSIEDITAATVPFTVTGSAPTNSVFVASNGKVGFRTASPLLDLHIATTDTPAIRLEQTNAGGFTAQTWDVAGNEANFFVRDLTGGSRLPFRIRPGAPTSSIDVAASGNVGVGTASPGASRINVSDTTQLAPRIGLTGQEFLAAANTSTDGIAMLLGVNRTGNRQLWIGDTASLAQNSTNKVVRISPNNGDVSVLSTLGVAQSMSLQSGGGFLGIGGVTAPIYPIQHQSGAYLSSGGVWTDASSRTLKEHIADLPLDKAKAALNELTPVTFNYKTAPTEHHVGFIAEDVPELVATETRKGISPMDVVAVLTSVVKDQQKTIDELKARLDAIESQK